MKKSILGAILIVFIGLGMWYYFGGKTSMNEGSSDMGSYAYLCNNGVEFSMEPSADVSSVRVIPGANATFSAATLATVESSSGARFEGSGMTFVGVGEEVQFTANGMLMICNPKPSQDMAPWNWGDVGEGGGVKQDASRIVSESIVGKWQSVDDEKFVRELKSDSTAQDWYENKVVTDGLWVAFTKMNAPEVSFPLEEDAVYLQMTMKGTQADTLTFKLSKLTSDELELIYMDRGGALRFRAVK